VTADTGANRDYTPSRQVRIGRQITGGRDDINRVLRLLQQQRQYRPGMVSEHRRRRYLDVCRQSGQLGAGAEPGQRRSGAVRGIAIVDASIPDQHRRADRHLCQRSGGREQSGANCQSLRASGWKPSMHPCRRVEDLEQPVPDRAVRAFGEHFEFGPRQFTFRVLDRRGTSRSRTAPSRTMGMTRRWMWTCRFRRSAVSHRRSAFWGRWWRLAYAAP
jgi:hypothetical protein